MPPLDARPQTSHHWLPFTQMAGFDRAERTFVAASGTRLTDARGRTTFDAISSVWTTIHGHGRPEIVSAIAEQAARLDHATALGATNPVAEELADRLARLTGLDYAFFASDGASAIEAAMKMAVQYWRLRGEPQRTRFVRLRESYHGDTIGAMSLSDVAVFKENFGALAFETFAYDDVHAFLDARDVAAIVVEPRVQAASGMRVVDEARYAPLRENHVPLLIVDEIATGFGRTGTLFAYEALGLKPDLVCLGKGITGGTLALSATLTRAHVHDAFLGAPDARKQFFHGHSYAANPIACAAALASLDLFATDGTLAHVVALDTMLGDALLGLARHPRVAEVRRVGLMCGIVLDERRFASSAQTPGWTVANALYARGHFTRPIGAVIQLVPPLSSRPEELTDFIAQLGTLLDILP
jgi:adenosylmethionine-8-amino-7-oxononanoate aminotransferase